VNRLLGALASAFGSRKPYDYCAPVRVIIGKGRQDCFIPGPRSGIRAPCRCFSVCEDLSHPPSTHRTINTKKCNVSQLNDVVGYSDKKICRFRWREQKRSFLANQLREAREAALHDSEEFDGIIHTVERLGICLTEQLRILVGINLTSKTQLIKSALTSEIPNACHFFILH